MKAIILVIDDQDSVRLSASFLLQNQGYQVLEASSPEQALTILLKEPVDIVLLDMNFSSDTTSGVDGISFLKELTEKGMSASVIAMTAWSSVGLVVEAMRYGACDFIEKPWENQRLTQVIAQQLKVRKLEQQNQGLKQQNSENCREINVIYESPQMKAIIKQLERISNSDATIMLTGENGTGKSNLAKIAHNLSSRENQNFIAVNMGAIPESLFESEMFGHKKGAFTDAKTNRIGRFQLAENGTLFLDEISNIPLGLQGKLLRVLEEKEFEAVGSNETLVTNARIICASNANMHKLIEEGQFRSDLYYRLNTFEIYIPPLRDRKGDIIPLTKQFLNTHCERYSRPSLDLSDEAARKLIGYNWPGNIRELSHIVERAVLLAEGSSIRSNDIHIDLKSNSQTETQAPSSPKEILSLDESEMQLISLALNKTSGNVIEAAEKLGISKGSLYRRMEKYGFNKSKIR